MRCPVCAHDETQIVATRESDESDVIRRCLKCEKRFTTDELSKIALPAVELLAESVGFSRRLAASNHNASHAGGSLPNPIKKQERPRRAFAFWRSRWDSNPRYAFGIYSLSRGAPSATRSRLLTKPRFYTGLVPLRTLILLSSAGHPSTSTNTSSEIARLEVSPGDSIPIRLTTPFRPWVCGPSIRKSAPGSSGPEIFARRPV